METNEISLSDIEDMEDSISFERKNELFEGSE